MRTSRRVPEIYLRLKRRFGVRWDDGLVITYGDTAYSKWEPTHDVLAHEAVHVRQQEAMGPVIWWERYMADAAFRMGQESEAYAEQARYLREHVDDPEEVGRRLEHMASCMARLYGNMCTLEEARRIVGIGGSVISG